MALALRYAARSDVGLVRDGNEDSGYAGPRLLAVADGVGGNAAGEVASSVAVSVLSQLDGDSPGPDLLEALSAAVRTANGHLRDMVAGDPDLVGMGTTLTALLRAGSRFGLVHVGDSRCYLLRGGAIQQITRDHTFVQTLVDEGRITAEEAENHPQKSLILRALDGRDDVELDLSVREGRSGDRYLLCSDGLSNVVSQDTLRDALADSAAPDTVVERLVELALRGGGPDNITAIVADVVEVEVSPSAVPVTVGAVAHGPVRRSTNDSAAAKAAALSPAPHRGHDDADDETDDEPPPPRRRGLTFLVAVLVLALLGGGAYGAWRWSQQQYYVGASGANVAIYRGLTQDVGPVKTSTLYERESVALTSLPAYHRARVEAQITASNLREARRIVGTLREQAQLCARATASPSPSPAGTPPAAPATPASPAASPTLASPPVPTPSPSTSSAAVPSPTLATPGTPVPSPTGTSPEALDCGGHR